GNSCAGARHAGRGLGEGRMASWPPARPKRVPLCAGVGCPYRLNWRRASALLRGGSVMEAPVIIREFSPIRGLRLFTSIPEGMRVVRIDRDRPGSIYSKGMYVVIDPSRTELVEGIDVALVTTGGPLD